MDFAALIVDNFETILAWVFGFFLFFCAALVCDRLPARDPEVRRYQKNFYGD